MEVRVGLVLEVGQPDIADAAVQDAGLDAVDGGYFPGDHIILRMCEALPINGEGRLAALGPRINFTASVRLIFLVSWPLILTIRFPANSHLVSGGPFDG